MYLHSCWKNNFNGNCSKKTAHEFYGTPDETFRSSPTEKRMALLVERPNEINENQKIKIKIEKVRLTWINFHQKIEELERGIFRELIYSSLFSMPQLDNMQTK